MELVKAGDPAGEVAGTEPEPKPEPAPEPKPEPAPAPEPKPEEKNTTDVSAVLNKLDTLISAIQSSNRINAEISDVKSNQQIVDDMLANIVNPTYSK
jgi:outer membrane biosynthesis protein TonB